MLRVAVCAKQVLNPDAVNNYAQWGRLKIDPLSKEVGSDGIPLVMNAFDEQAIEAALRLRDRGAACKISVLTVGGESCRELLKSAFAIGADDGFLLMDQAFQNVDGIAIAHILARAIEKLGGTDLILCGRQASDNDQGVVGPALAHSLGGIPIVSIARDVQLVDEKRVRVTRVLADGEEVVEVDLPAVVTVSNELGTPRYPVLKGIVAARRKQATVWTAADVGAVSYLETRRPRVRRVDLFVPTIQSKCQFVQGTGAEELASGLLETLRQEHLI